MEIEMVDQMRKRKKTTQTKRHKMLWTSEYGEKKNMLLHTSQLRKMSLNQMVILIELLVVVYAKCARSHTHTFFVCKSELL